MLKKLWLQVNNIEKVHFVQHLSKSRQQHCHVQFPFKSPYAHHYKPRLVYFLSHFLVQFIIEITQKYIDQLNVPENKNVALEKFLHQNHPQTLPLLTRRGPRCQNARMSQYYMGPKMKFVIFPSLTKEISCIYGINL